VSFSTRGILAGSGLALSGLLLLWLGRPRPSREQPRTDRRLLVMPLEVEAPMPENAWLRHGLAELIRLQLRQGSRLHPIPADAAGPAAAASLQAVLKELRGVAEAPEADAVNLTQAGWGF
jgi:hypothetical protein